MALAAQKGRVTNDDATVFKTPDFDGEVIGTLRTGEIYDISDKQRGPFFKIRVRSGVVGWISDADIAPLGSISMPSRPTAPAKAKNKKSNPKTAKTPPQPMKPVRPIQRTRYRGIDISQVNFTENTMGKKRTSSMKFFGARFSGPNTLIDGDMYIDTQVLFSSSPPDYYGKATGQASSGFAFLADFMFVTDIPQTRDVMAYYGFGPMLRFSQFNVLLPDDPSPGLTKGYQLSDAAIGAVFGLGVAVALSDSIGVRLDGRYYWEAQQYTGLGLSIQMPF